MSAVKLLLKLLIPLSAIFLALVYYKKGFPCSCPIVESFTPPCKDYELASPAYPRVTSWKTWFHPSQSWEASNAEPPKKDWNLLRHLGGNGPWVEHVGGNKGPWLGESNQSDTLSLAPPEGCLIDQVHMMSRHAERFPTHSAGNRHLQFLERLRALATPLNGSLAFLNNWTYFTDNPSRDFGQLTSTGPYAGTLGAFTTGVRFRTRYSELLPKDTKTRLWASDSQRVIDTARYFASGLFGLDWESAGKAELQVIPETFERGADTLTPGDTCRKYLDSEQGHDLGLEMLARFQEVYIPDIATRLLKENPALGDLASWEVFGMQEMCGSEIMVRGSSPWCDAFTEQDWYHFEYARDLLHYYRAGPGNSYAASMGWLYLNATSSLLKAGPEAGSLFLSFVHDGDIAPFLTALGILDDPEYAPFLLPTDEVADWRVWKTSTVLPMGARVILERMSCSSEEHAGRVHIRVNINNRIVPLRFCQDGPGRSCDLNTFEEHVFQKGHQAGPFGEVCGLEGHADRITFLRQD